MKNCYTQTRKFLMAKYGLTDAEAATFITVGVDFATTQLVDGRVLLYAIDATPARWRGGRLISTQVDGASTPRSPRPCSRRRREAVPLSTSPCFRTALCPHPSFVLLLFRTVAPPTPRAASDVYDCPRPLSAAAQVASLFRTVPGVIPGGGMMPWQPEPVSALCLRCALLIAAGQTQTHRITYQAPLDVTTSS